jgi:hypothetical protein
MNRVSGQFLRMDSDPYGGQALVVELLKTVCM